MTQNVSTVGKALRFVAGVAALKMSYSENRSLIGKALLGALAMSSFKSAMTGHCPINSALGIGEGNDDASPRALRAAA